MNGKPVQPPKNSLFALSLVLVVGGTTLLLLTTGVLPRLYRVWPMGITAVGCLITYLGVTRRLSALWLFAGSFFLLSGILLLIRGIFGWPVAYYWPFFMVILGLSILAPGYRRYRRLRAVYLVPALSFVLLGGCFLLFSFDIVLFSFRRFFSEWWPAFLIVMGLILLALYLHNRARFARTPRQGAGS